MSKKTIKIISIILAVLPSLMLIMSAFMKLSGSQQLKDAMGKSGLGNYIVLLGVIELVSVVLFLIPKTSRIGFLLLCSYLGGALSIELAAGQPPMAMIFLVLIWVSVFLRKREVFLADAGAMVNVD